jgi:hypothetical protein
VNHEIYSKFSVSPPGHKRKSQRKVVRFFSQKLLPYLNCEKPDGHWPNTAGTVEARIRLKDFMKIFIITLS